MNKGMIVTSLRTIGSIGAAINGIARRAKNGTIQRLPQTVSNALKPLQKNMATNQNAQQTTGAM